MEIVQCLKDLSGNISTVEGITLTLINTVTGIVHYLKLSRILDKSRTSVRYLSFNVRRQYRSYDPIDLPRSSVLRKQIN